MGTIAIAMYVVQCKKYTYIKLNVWGWELAIAMYVHAVQSFSLYSHSDVWFGELHIV